jgi:hypothetical protein
MKNRCRHTGHALAGTMMFLLIAMIMWLSVTRQLGTYLRMEKSSQSLQLYNDTTIRALSWGLTLLETGLPPSNPYSCKMRVGRNSLQTFVVSFIRTSNLHYTVTARPADGGDDSLPEAPENFD